MQDEYQKIIARKFARESGLKFYYTGVLCKYGHLSVRYTKHAACRDCNNASREKNIREGNQRYIENCRAGHKRWLQKNPIKAWYQAIKSGAKRRGIPFDLEFDDMPVRTHCKACGVQFDERVGRATDSRATIDRIDNSLGYTKSNIEMICNKCNSLKRDFTIDDMCRILQYMMRET